MPAGEEDIVLFGGGIDGSGYAHSIGRDTYHWSVGFDCRSGKAVPAAAYTRVLSNVEFSPVKCLFEWELATFEPILIWTGGDGAGNATIYEWENATLTESDHNQPFFTAGVLYRHDGSDLDAEVAWFCNGSSANAMIERLKDGTIRNTSHDAKADLITVTVTAVGGDF